MLIQFLATLLTSSAHLVGGGSPLILFSGSPFQDSYCPSIVLSGNHVSSSLFCKEIQQRGKKNIGWNVVCNCLKEKVGKSGKEIEESGQG